jgi:hypothetical protein
MPRFSRPAIACIALLASVPSLAAPKTDVVVFLNGDRLTGEVKGMEYGKLSFKTDATGTIEIEWDDIASVETKQYLQIELANGLRYLGQAPPPSSEGSLRITASEESPGKEIKLADIVRISTIDRGSLVDRLDGYVTAGVDYTKANDLTQMSFTGGISSRNEKRQWSIDGSTTSTEQEGQDDQQRFDVWGTSRYFLKNRNFYQGFLGLEGNDQLGLDLRTTVGGALGRYLTQGNNSEWAAYGGLALTREDSSAQEKRESVEGVLGTQYTYFRYDAPEASFNAQLNLFPSLTESGRVRAEGKLRGRYEIVDDLFFELSLYGSFDNEPDQEAESDSDYGFTTSLGYSF